MDTPIFDMIFSTPLPSALIRLATAWRAGDPGEQAGARHVLDRLDGQVGADRRGAVADEQRDVVALADVTGLDHQAWPGAGALPHQVMVHRAGEQERRDRRVPGIVLGGPASQEWAAWWAAADRPPGNPGRTAR